MSKTTCWPPRDLQNHLGKMAVDKMSAKAAMFRDILELLDSHSMMITLLMVFDRHHQARQFRRDFSDASQLTRPLGLQTSTNRTQLKSSLNSSSSRLKMPRGPKKRKPTVKSFNTVPNPKKQVVLTTKNLTTIKVKHPAWSAPNMRQQSITQMDPLRDYYHPELDNEVLKTDEEEDSYVASPTRNKRRRVTPEKQYSRKIETRSAKRQAAKEEPAIEEQENQVILPSPGVEAKAHMLRAKMSTAMLPPNTPVSLRRKEIPSSQSPADTPFSAQSRQSLRDYTRSPLKEKSTNIDSSLKSPMKGARWSKVLEVADSMETEDEDSPPPVRVESTSGFVGSIAEPEHIAGEEPQLPSHAFSVHVDDFNERLRAAQRPVKEIQNSSQSRLRHEVVDSTDEENDNEEAEAFNAGLETQAALASTDFSQKGSGQSSKPMPTTLRPARDEAELPPVQRNASASPDPLNAQTRSARQSNVENHIQVHSPKKVEFVDLASSDPPCPTTPSPLRERPSDPEEASAQLFADLRRDTQPMGLQTESQYEQGWTTYTPADDINSDLEPVPYSGKPVEPPSSGVMTVPTQFIRPPISTPPKFYKAPVPPSQATTVDLTQPSPRNVTSSSQAVTQRSSRNLPSSSQAHPSSPPPMPPPSSSPLESRKLDPWAGYKWDGVRLTESQLLPDSLLEDSQVGPPPLSQESWAEEL